MAPGYYPTGPQAPGSYPGGPQTSGPYSQVPGHYPLGHPTPPRKSNKVALFVIGGIVLALVAAVIITWTVSNQNRPKPMPVPSPSTSTRTPTTATTTATKSPSSTKSPTSGGIAKGGLIGTSNLGYIQAPAGWNEFRDPQISTSDNYVGGLMNVDTLAIINLFRPKQMSGSYDALIAGLKSSGTIGTFEKTVTVGPEKLRGNVFKKKFASDVYTIVIDVKSGAPTIATTECKKSTQCLDETYDLVVNQFRFNA